VIRALGRAWVESDGKGGWRRRRGRSPDGALTEAEAAERMLALIDLPSVKSAMSHARITTTERYLHARPASELADRFTRALAGSSLAAVA
jgi:hypothetical protein